MRRKTLLNEVAVSDSCHVADCPALTRRHFSQNCSFLRNKPIWPKGYALARRHPRPVNCSGRCCCSPFQHLSVQVSPPLLRPVLQFGRRSHLAQRFLFLSRRSADHAESKCLDLYLLRQQRATEFRRCTVDRPMRGSLNCRYFRTWIHADNNNCSIAAVFLGAILAPTN